MDRFFDYFVDSVWWINVFLSIWIVYLNRRRPARSTTLWLMIMALMPVLGFIPYLLIGRDTRRRTMFQEKESQDKNLLQQSLIEWDAQLEDRPIQDEGRFEDYKELIQLNDQIGFSKFSADNQVDVLIDGKEKFDRLLLDIQQAQQSIEFQYYIIRSDQLGRKVLDALVLAALRGVQVRLIVDGIGGRYLRKADLQRIQEAGGQVGVFFPSFLRFFNLRMNYRNHRKIVVIDDKIAYIGGFNVGDEYLGRTKRFGYWRDTHVRIAGPACADLKLSFLQDWQYITGGDLSGEGKIIPSPHPQGQDFCQLVSSGPDTMQPSIKFAMMKMISSANRQIIIQTPYFIPDTSIYESLVLAMQQGVEVHLMIPDKPDHMVVFPATMSFAGDLIRAGAKVYQYHGGFLHCKVLLIDDYVSMVGSCNMDERSFSLNFEASEVIYSYQVSEKLRQSFLEDSKQSTLLTLDRLKDRPLSLKIKEPFCRLFAPIL